MDEGASIDSHAEWTVGPLGVRSAAMTIVVGTGVLGATRGGVSFLDPLLVTAAVIGVTGAVAAVEGNLWMWDVWGLVLAVPIMVAIKAAADHIEPLQPLGELLGR